jgi:hypothetical protein
MQNPISNFSTGGQKFAACLPTFSLPPLPFPLLMASNSTGRC